MENKILIIDDDTTYLTVVKKWLSKKYLVVALKSGEQAIKFLEGHGVDLILLDSEMPTMSGEETFKAIRNMGKNTPVFFLTGNADEESLKNLTALNPEKILKKSMTQKEIMAAIETFFGVN